jgi:hypothetical protein
MNSGLGITTHFLGSNKSSILLFVVFIFRYECATLMTMCVLASILNPAHPLSVENNHKFMGKKHLPHHLSLQALTYMMPFNDQSIQQKHQTSNSYCQTRHISVILFWQEHEGSY